MAISKKLPNPKKESVITTDENKVLELINKGGKVPIQKEGSKIIKGVHLRLPEELVTQIDVSRSKDYGVSYSRHSWITQAIIEKLEKE